MLQYSELTVVKNTDGLPSALGIPINSFIMKNDMLSGIFSGGGGKKKEKKGKKEKKEKREEEEEEKNPDTLYDENLAVPMGLVCKTETVCRSAPAAQYVYEDANDNANDNANANANAYANAYANANTNLDESDIEIVPDSLYNKLLDLLNMPDPSKKMTRRVKDKKMAHGSSKPAQGSNKPAHSSNKGKKTRRNNKK